MGSESFQSIADLSCFFSDGMLHLKTRMSHAAHDEEMITSWVVSGWIKNLTKKFGMDERWFIFDELTPEESLRFLSNVASVKGGCSSHKGHSN